MQRLPYLKFYPGDWLRDNVAGCSLAAQGLWLRIIILAHDCDSYGVLERNSKPIPDDVVARQCGCDPREFEGLLKELENSGVTRRTRNGALYCSWMTREAERRAGISRERSLAGKSGNRKRWIDRKTIANESQTDRNCDEMLSQNHRYSDSDSGSDSKPKKQGAFFQNAPPESVLKNKSPPEKPKELRTHAYLQVFLEKWREKYGREYVVGNFAQAGGSAKTLEAKVRDIAVFSEAVASYLESDDRRIVESGHPFAWFVNDVNRWMTKASGQTATGADAWLRSKLAEMPPEQRAALEAEMHEHR